MKRTVASILLMLAVTTVVSTVWDIRPDSFFSSTVFTVAGIMFSIGLGLIVTFVPNGIKNKSYLKTIRQNITEVRNSFLSHFSLTTFYYILNQYFFNYEFVFQWVDKINIAFSVSIFLCLLMIYSSIFFIANFIQIQKLNNDIFDKVSEEQERRKDAP